MLNLAAFDVHQTAFSTAHFGGNILATRDRLGEEGTFDEAADFLNLGAIRYPGGSLTERYFDISDPDRSNAPEYDGEGTQTLLPFTEFMVFAEQTERAALIVLPTRVFLSEDADRNGDRYAAVDETVLRGFIRDTLDGTYGAPKIAGFEIGNKYWDSGEMNSVEYGRIASQMATIIDDEIHNHPDYETHFQDVDILVQMGMNYGYGSLEGRYAGSAEEQLAQFAQDYDLTLDDNYIYSNGRVAWPQLANLLVIREFDLPEERAAIDGIVAHTYSRGEFANSSHYFALQTLTQTWSEEFPDLSPVVTEWNVRNRGRDENEDFGLVQATEMLDLLEAMTNYGVEEAYVYPVQQRSPSSLTGDRGEVEEKLAGVFFQILQETLPGTRSIVLEGATGRETELVTEQGEVHVFGGEDRLVLYITSTVSEDTDRMQMDLTGLIEDYDDITIEKLGVAEGDAPGSSSATAVRSTLNGDSLFRDGVLSISLAPREIVEVVISGVTYTEDTAAALGIEPQPFTLPDNVIFLDIAPELPPSSFETVQVLSDGSVLVEDDSGQAYIYSSTAFAGMASRLSNTRSALEIEGRTAEGDAVADQTPDRLASDSTAGQTTASEDDVSAQWAALLSVAAELTDDDAPQIAAAAAEEDDGGSSDGFDPGGLFWALGLLPLLALAAAF